MTLGERPEQTSQTSSMTLDRRAAPSSPCELARRAARGGAAAARAPRGPRARRGAGAGGDVTFAIDERAEAFDGGPSSPSALPTSPSTPRTAAWSPRPATPLGAVVDPIDGTRPALAGFESACVSVAAAPLDGEPTMGDVEVGCIVEIKSGAAFRRRARRRRSTRRRGCRANDRPRADVLDLRPARPARRAPTARCSPS